MVPFPIAFRWRVVATACARRLEFKPWPGQTLHSVANGHHYASTSMRSSCFVLQLCHEIGSPTRYTLWHNARVESIERVLFSTKRIPYFLKIFGWLQKPNKHYLIIVLYMNPANEKFSCEKIILLQ